MPQGYKKDVKFINQNVGPEKRQDILDNIDYKGGYLPKSIYYEDIDKTFLDFIENVLEIDINGVTVPVYFFTIQRFAEFSKLWDTSDKFKNVKIPFITVVRQPDIQVGTNQAGIWNVPGHKLYTYMKVPNFVGGRDGVDLYKIPQPTSVDITYDVRFFCNRMRDLNMFNRKIQFTFQSRQYYINVGGHPMPIHLEKIGDESQIDDFDRRRFYVQHFEMKVLGYILDEDDFEFVPTVNRMIVFTELMDKTIKPKIVIRSFKDIDEICLNVVIKADHFSDEFIITMIYDAEITSLTFVKNVTNVNMAINGVQQTFPFIITANEQITLTVDRDENNETKFQIIGIVK
jgi:hypothetical protein|tara:strand:- start:15223 stop:16254 length:1032 start_codon:yes stop_codon:yes gene_type:complete